MESPALRALIHHLQSPSLVNSSCPEEQHQHTLLNIQQKTKQSILKYFIPKSLAFFFFFFQENPFFIYKISNTVFLKPSLWLFSPSQLCPMQECVERLGRQRESLRGTEGHCGVCTQGQPCKNGKGKKCVWAGNAMHCRQVSQLS